MKFKLGVGILRAIQEDTSYGRETSSSPAEVRAWQAINADWREASTTVVTVHLDEEARQSLVSRITLMAMNWADRSGLADDDLVALYYRREQQAKTALKTLALP